MKLERYEQNGLEVVIDLETGEVYASQSATARMCKVTETTIRKFVSSNRYSPILAEIPTAVGLRSSSLLDEDFIHKCISKYNPAFLIECSKCGLRVYLHQLAGFQVTSTAIQAQDSTNQLLLQILAVQEAQSQQINEMRLEMQQQNERLTLMLPDHEMMNSIREAIDDLENLKPILEAISQSLKDNPCQPLHPLKYYLVNKKCGRGLRIRIGQMVSGWLALSKGCKLDKLNGFQNSANLYPECAFPLIILAWQICTV